LLDRVVVPLADFQPRVAVAAAVGGMVKQGGRFALADDVDVPMPITAATRAILQMHMGHAMAQKNPEEYLAKDFATLMETMALSSGMKLESENKQVPTGLE